MSRVLYLVAATDGQGVKDAEGHGWERIAATRFVTSGKDDVRIVSRTVDLHPLAGETPMIKGSDYDSGPEAKFLRQRWLGTDERAGERQRFEEFMRDGNGVWIDAP